MSAPDNDENVVDHLEAALEAEDPNQKNFHIRQALQFLGIE